MAMECPTPVGQFPEDPQKPPKGSTSNGRVKIMLAFVAAFLLASAAAVGVWARMEGNVSGETRIRVKPTRAISLTCRKTRYPNLCVTSLLEFPGALSASRDEFVHISVNLTMQRFEQALSRATDIGNLPMSGFERSAYDDCLDLLEESSELLSKSLASLGSSGKGSAAAAEDVQTWLSAALTNHETCKDGIQNAGGSLKAKMSERSLKDLSELVSNCLAIFVAAEKNNGGDFSGVPVQHRRRKLLTREEDFPVWVSRQERRLLDAAPGPVIRADIIVSKDGNGTVKTIAEAIEMVPEKSDRRTIIYVREGRYEEKNLKIDRKKINVMIFGDGMGKTIISGGRSVVADNITTFHTASFAATGAGFIAKDMTFENWAGPENHQAVALRVGADHAVVHRCEIKGYQDTLYVHSQRQFYRDCEIYGTVDFIFGNAAVVFQKCGIFARRPLPSQKNTVTAQSRKDPYQNTGMSLHDCRILAADDLEAAKLNYSTYLGRPWKMYSRAVVMMSYIGDHVHSRGWLEWNETFALDTLYYGEYNNTGPGAALNQRVNWTGYHLINTTAEAYKFTVASFIFGSSWLPPTGVAFLAGLTT
ncbi:unnamed protein product [Cuscuta campestris]|uniref:Pectinesterase n=1 Tax=Cuscuta campestris TaxID=132261 RepID=A0A484KP96_9ASTE|nr:unnamed protein product [Cuscuta campestris]